MLYMGKWIMSTLLYFIQMCLGSCLNLSNVLGSLMLFGSSFHSVVVAWLNDLAAKDLYFAGGMLSIFPVLFDHMVSLFGFLISTRSMIYFGVVLFMPLYVIVSILNWICCFIVNQWRSISASVVLEYFEHCNKQLSTRFVLFGIWLWISVVDRTVVHCHNQNVICITWGLMWCVPVWRDISVFPLYVWSLTLLYLF